MGYLEIYLCIVAGIGISLILPILRKAIPSARGQPRFQSRFWDAFKNYLVILPFSLLVGLLMLATVTELLDWKTALLTGYAWDSTLQKLKGD